VFITHQLLRKTVDEVSISLTLGGGEHEVGPTPSGAKPTFTD